MLRVKVCKSLERYRDRRGRKSISTAPSIHRHTPKRGKKKGETKIRLAGEKCGARVSSRLFSDTFSSTISPAIEISPLAMIKRSHPPLAPRMCAVCSHALTRNNEEANAELSRVDDGARARLEQSRRGLKPTSLIIFAR